MPPRAGHSFRLRLAEHRTRFDEVHLLPLYNVDLMNPCWIYRGLAFDNVGRIDVRIGALPYFFELWHDAANVVRHAPSGPGDELQLHVDSCDGPLLATVPLSAENPSPAATVSATISQQAGVHDVCLFFATHGDDPLRLIDWVEPVMTPH